MRGVNKAILVGSLGGDPEHKYMPSGNAVANVSLATSRSWKDKCTGERQERTDWHRIVFFGRLAEMAGEYLRKGSKVYIEGRMQTRKWRDRDGIARWTTEIVAKELQMMGGGKNNSDTRPQEPQTRIPATRNPRRTSASPHTNLATGDNEPLNNPTPF